MAIGLWLKDWAQPLSAGATLAAVIVALGLGWWSLKQTQSLQEKEHKGRLLSEIYEWVKGIYESFYEMREKESRIEFYGSPEARIQLETSVTVQFKYSNAMRRAARGVDVELSEALVNVVKKLDSYWDSYRDDRGKWARNPENTQELDRLFVGLVDKISETRLKLKL